MSCKPMTEETRKWIHEKYGHLWPDADAGVKDKLAMEEARNIATGAPLWPGDTLSHATAQDCYKRGWAIRDADGNWVPTIENPYYPLPD